MQAAVAPGLYAFLHNLIDYAGLFPPANLPLQEAIYNFIRYRSEPEHWMLSRFIIPAAKLDELSQILQKMTWNGALAFSVLGQGGVDDRFLTGVASDIRAVDTFRAAFGARVRLEMYETRLPIPGRDAQIGKRIAEVIPSLHGAGLFPFFETPFGEGWASRAESLILALSQQPNDFSAGFKLRTGGVTADAFPTPEQVAFVLCVCQEAQVVMKCTAGLHHPVRSFQAEVGTKMHGFLNGFGAGMLVGRLDAAQVEAILEEDDPASFSFSEQGMSWRGFQVQVDEIVSRRKRLVSFGSCSFEEPRADLGAMGLYYR